MRLNWLLLLMIAFAGCKQPTNSYDGKWFNKEFGVVVINNSAFTHFSNNSIPKISWPLKQGNIYECNEIAYEGCKKRANLRDSILVTIEKLDNLLLLKSEHPCFPMKPFEKYIKLENIPESKGDFKYDFISVQTRIDGKWKEVILTKEDINGIANKDSSLTLDQQLWIIFFSGTDFYHDEYSPNQNLILKFKSGGYQNVKSINIFPYPPHIRPFLNYVTLELNK